MSAATLNREETLYLALSLLVFAPSMSPYTSYPGYLRNRHNRMAHSTEPQTHIIGENTLWPSASHWSNFYSEIEKPLNQHSTLIPTKHAHTFTSIGHLYMWVVLRWVGVGAVSEYKVQHCHHHSLFAYFGNFKFGNLTLDRQIAKYNSQKYGTSCQIKKVFCPNIYLARYWHFRLLRYHKSQPMAEASDS